MKGTQAFLAGLVALLLAGVAVNPANALQVAPEGLTGPGRPSENVLRAFVPVEFGNLKTNPTRFCELAERQDFLAQGETADSCVRSHWHGQFPYMGWDEYATFSRVGYKADEVYLFPLDRGKFQDFVVASNGGVNLDVATSGNNNPALVVENSMLRHRLETAEVTITNLRAQVASNTARATTPAPSSLGREAQLEIQLVDAGVKIGELEQRIRDLNARTVNPQAAIDAAVQAALARQAEATRREVARVQDDATATITANRIQAEADVAAADARLAAAELRFAAEMRQAAVDLTAAKAVTTARDETIRSLNRTIDTQEDTISNLNQTVATLDNWGAHTAIGLNSWMASASDFANAHSLLIVLALIVLLAGTLAYRFTDSVIAGLRHFRPASANATS